jgi:hypothetical protein
MKSSRNCQDIMFLAKSFISAIMQRWCYYISSHLTGTNYVQALTFLTFVFMCLFQFSCGTRIKKCEVLCSCPRCLQVNVGIVPQIGHDCFLSHSFTMAAYYRGADKSLARPGRKQATPTEDFDFHISYL